MSVTQSVLRFDSLLKLLRVEMILEDEGLVAKKFTKNAVGVEGN